MAGNVILRFQLPLSASVALPIEAKLRRRIEALCFHPGDKARIRAADRALVDEPNGEAELEVRRTMAGNDLTITSTWVEVMDDNTYRVRHAVDGHSSMVSGAALDEASDVEIGYGALFMKSGQVWACLFKDCYPEDIAADRIAFARKPLPVTEFGRAFLYQNDDPSHPGLILEELRQSPHSGEFHLRIGDGFCHVIAAPWMSGLSTSELSALEQAFHPQSAPSASEECVSP